RKAVGARRGKVRPRRLALEGILPRRAPSLQQLQLRRRAGAVSCMGIRGALRQQAPWCGRRRAQTARPSCPRRTEQSSNRRLPDSGSLNLTQQDGLFHGGAVASLVDVACGYAALSVMPEEREVLTVEFKVHFLNPAKTDRVIAVGKVVQAGRTLTVCEGSAFDATRTRLLARMTATMMAV